MVDVLSSRNPDRAILLQQVASSLRDLTRRLVDARDQMARANNLHSTDLACIEYLERQFDPVSPKQLVAEMKLSASSGTGLLDRLERSGYIKRVPNPNDRRSVHIELDRAKARLALKRYRQLEDGFRQMTDQFSERDLQTISSFLEGVDHLVTLAADKQPTKD